MEAAQLNSYPQDGWFSLVLLSNQFASIAQMARARGWLYRAIVPARVGKTHEQCSTTLGSIGGLSTNRSAEGGRQQHRRKFHPSAVIIVLSLIFVTTGFEVVV